MLPQRSHSSAQSKQIMASSSGQVGQASVQASVLHICVKKRSEEHPDIHNSPADRSLCSQSSTPDTQANGKRRTRQRST